MKLLRLARQSSLVRFARDRRGSVPLLVALAMAGFIGVSSLAIDSAYHYVLRGKLQAAADATALAAVSQLPDPAATRSMAQEYAAKNMPPEIHGTALRQEDIILGNWAEQTRTFTPSGNPANAARVTLRRAAANDNAAPPSLRVCLESKRSTSRSPRSRDQTTPHACLRWIRTPATP